MQSPLRIAITELLLDGGRFLRALLKRFWSLCRWAAEHSGAVTIAVAALVSIFVIAKQVNDLSGRGVIVVPFETVGDKAEPVLGNSAAASLAFALNDIREVFSQDLQDRLADVVQFAPLLSRVAIVPEIKLGHHGQEAIAIKPWQIGPVSISLKQLVLDLWPARESIVIEGRVEKYGTTAALTIRERNGPFRATERISDGNFEDAIGALAFRLVAAKWVGDRPRNWKSVRSFAEGLKAFQSYLFEVAVSGWIETDQIDKAKDDLAAAIDGDRAWLEARLYEATLGFNTAVELAQGYTPETGSTLRQAASTFADVGLTSSPSELVYLESLIGEMNARSLLVYAYYDDPDCENAKLDLTRLQQLYRSSGSDGLYHRIAGRSARVHKFYEGELQFARGHAELVFLRLAIDPSHDCGAKLVGDLSTPVNQDELFARAQESFQAALRPGAAGQNPVRIKLADLHTRWSEHLLRSDRREESGKHLSQAIAIRQSLKGMHSLSMERAWLADSLWRKSNLEADEAKRHDLLQRATIQYWSLASSANGWYASWTRLKAAELHFIGGEWRRAMDTFLSGIVAVQEDYNSQKDTWQNAKPPCRFSEVRGDVRAATAGSPPGFFIVKPDRGEEVVQLLKLSLCNNYSNRNLLARALLAEVLASRGDLEAANQQIEKLDELLSSTSLWYGPLLELKLRASKAKVLAYPGQDSSAQEALEAAEEIRSRIPAGTEKAIAPMVFGDLLVASLMLGDQNRASYYCQALKDRHPASAARFGAYLPSLPGAAEACGDLPG